MSAQHDYLVMKAHIDELVRAAERARIGRGPDFDAPEVPAECP